MSDSHFVVATCKFIIPTILHVIEAWTNGIFDGGTFYSGIWYNGVFNGTWGV
jgi:hypothetical protein